MLLAFNLVQLPAAWVASKHPIAVSSLLSIIFMINTMVLSFLLDLRLLDQSGDYQRDRVRDGIILGLFIAGVIVILQLGIIALGVVFEMLLPDFSFAVRAIFTALFAVLGFAMGYLIPSTAQAHIEASRIIVSSAEKEGYFIEWPTQRPLAPPPP
jgi:hypothetical protein